jgi:hypothetical protein
VSQVFNIGISIKETNWSPGSYHTVNERHFKFGFEPDSMLSLNVSTTWVDYFDEKTRRLKSRDGLVLIYKIAFPHLAYRIT